MTTLPPIYQKWLEQLLGKSMEGLLSSLEQWPEESLHPDAIYALKIVWQLHPDEDIQEKVYQCLLAICKKSELVQCMKQFDLFRSVSEILPWMQEDSTEIQERNFELFYPIKEFVEPFFAQSEYYGECYLDVARKLYMLFKLEDAAESCFKGLLKYAPNNDEALYALGRIEEHRNNYDQAIELYEQSVAAKAENIYAQLQLGGLKTTLLQDYRGAIEHYNKVIEIDPYSAEPYVRVAESYYKLEEYPRAKQFLEIALGINEFQEKALNLLGTYYWKVEKDYDKAVETYQKGLDHHLHGDSAILLASLGDLHAQYMQDVDKAKLYYSKSLKVDPTQKMVLEQYVPILIQHFQDFGEVTNCYENYLNQEPTDLDILVAYAAFLIEYLHDYEAAYQHLQQALKLDDKHYQAKKLYNQIGSYIEDNELEEQEEDADDDDFTGGGAAGDS